MANIKEQIIRMIDEAKGIPALVEEKSDLYTDLCFDSLSFIRLLLRIEEEYSIGFGIEQMGDCLNVAGLIAVVESKLGE